MQSTTCTLEVCDTSSMELNTGLLLANRLEISLHGPSYQKEQAVLGANITNLDRKFNLATCIPPRAPFAALSSLRQNGRKLVVCVFLCRGIFFLVFLLWIERVNSSVLRCNKKILKYITIWKTLYSATSCSELTTATIVA